MSIEAIRKGLKNIWCFLPEICITTTLIIMFGDSIFTMIRDGVSAFFLIISAILGALLTCSVGQFFWKKLAISFAYSILFGFGSIYMTLALVSEYKEFPAGDPQGLQMLLFGLFLFGGMAIASFIMPWKYIWSFSPGKQLELD